MKPLTVAAIERWSAVSDTQRLAIVVAHDVSILPALAAECQQRFGFHLLDLGPVLGDALLSVKPSRRAGEAERWLLTACQEVEHPLMLASIDLLFHPALEPHSSFRLDPLALFKRVSRVTPLAVLWPGAFENMVLSYAVPEHRHYRCWRLEPAIPVISAA